MSTQDSLFMLQVILNLKDTKTPDANWDAIAAAMGLKSAGVARTRFGQIKRKLMQINGLQPASPTKTLQTPRKTTPAKKRKNVEPDFSTDDASDSGESPTKKVKAEIEDEQALRDSDF